jgi:hypothetical protein
MSWVLVIVVGSGQLMMFDFDDEMQCAAAMGMVDAKPNAPRTMFCEPMLWRDA